MPTTQPQRIRGPIRRPEYSVVLELPTLVLRAECDRCAAVAGAPCSVRHSDGSLTTVAPHGERVASTRRLYRIEAPNLEDLADVIEREVRAVHPNQHVGVYLDPDGTVFVRLGWTASEPAGTWKAVSS